MICPICKENRVPFINKPELLLYGTCEDCLIILERERQKRRISKWIFVYFVKKKQKQVSVKNVLKK